MLPETAIADVKRPAEKPVHIAPAIPTGGTAKTASRNVVLCAVRYSPNLGDGVISDCLEYSLKAHLPDLQVSHIDLAGRDHFGHTSFKNRSLALRLLPRIPRVLRHRLIKAVLGRKLDGLEPGWRAQIAGADRVIIGGGHLFSDADLNFPLKIARIAKLCREMDVATSLYGIGATSGWSRAGTALFATIADTALRYAAVRDAGSREAACAQLPQLGVPVAVVPDPAVIADQCYGPAPDAVRTAGAGRVGICITANEVLAYHANGAVTGAAGSDLFAQVIDRLCSAGTPVALFTNGAAEDERTLARLWNTPQLACFIADGRLTRHAPFQDPRALAHAISAHDAIIAHRLHASIIAYAYRVPAVGLGWDQKVQSFYAATGRADHCIADSGASAAQICAQLDRARADGIDPAHHDRIRAKAARGIADLLV